MACGSLQRRRGGVAVVVMLATVTLGTLYGFHSIKMMQSARYIRGAVVQPAAGEALSGVGVRDPECAPHKRILIWTTFWKQQSTVWERIFFRQVSRQCPESRCELVYDHRLVDSVAAVVFHQGDMKPSYSIPATRPPGQPWVFLSLESPSSVVGSNVNLARLGGVFNWTMTYRRDSDVVVPYGLVLPRTPPLHSGKDYWAGKSSKLLAAWAVSHCHTVSRREWFVKEMAEHMSVDVFGSCGTKKCGKHLTVMTIGIYNQSECFNTIQDYMFYLAFENSICLDYITEKFYQTLTLDVVPVVLGGGPYEDIAPPHSYVDALAFPSPKHLAKYLKELANDRDAYNEFFAWKQHYTVELGHPFLPLVCDLCAKLHDPASLSPPNVTRSPVEQAGVQGRDGNGSYPDLHSWFVKGSGCRRWWSAEDRRKHSHK